MHLAVALAARWKLVGPGELAFANAAKPLPGVCLGDNIEVDGDIVGRHGCGEICGPPPTK